VGKSFTSIVAGQQPIWQWTFAMGNAVADTLDEAKAIINCGS